MHHHPKTALKECNAAVVPGYEFELAFIQILVKIENIQPERHSRITVKAGFEKRVERHDPRVQNINLGISKPYLSCQAALSFNKHIRLEELDIAFGQPQTVRLGKVELSTPRVWCCLQE